MSTAMEVRNCCNLGENYKFIVSDLEEFLKDREKLSVLIRNRNLNHSNLEYYTLNNLICALI